MMSKRVFSFWKARIIEIFEIGTAQLLKKTAVSPDLTGKDQIGWIDPIQSDSVIKEDSTLPTFTLS